MIRITGGKFRGRKIKSPPPSLSRPTLDTVREALFNILGNRLEGVRFLDLYAGVGLVGIEALSRGAQEAVFVERDLSVVRLLRENLRLLDLEQQGKIYHGWAQSLILRLIKHPFQIIFLDPPYDSPEAAFILTKLGYSSLEPETQVIVQHHYKQKLSAQIGALVQTRETQYGETLLSFYLPLGKT